MGFKAHKGKAHGGYGKYASLRVNLKALNSSSKARQRDARSKSSHHSEVRILVRDGMDVSALGITLSPKLPVISAVKGKKLRRRKRKGRTNPNAIPSA